MPLKTTLIITNLTKEDFLANKSYSEYQVTSKREAILFADKIKLEVLNLPYQPSKDAPIEEDYYLSNIQHWSTLPFLSRIIIILHSENAAISLHQFLTSDKSIIHQSALRETPVKVTLQENLLSRSRSQDSLADNSDEKLLQVLKKFKKYYNGQTDSEPGSPILNDYEEPEPKRINVYDDLIKMGIDPASFNDSDQLSELKLPQSTVGVSRSKSLTKTLFKPDLKVNTTSVTRAEPVPQSPTITLEETF